MEVFSSWFIHAYFGGFYRRNFKTTVVQVFIGGLAYVLLGLFRSSINKKLIEIVLKKARLIIRESDL